MSDGWDNAATAKAYAEFCRGHEMYAATSADLVALAAVHGDQTVVDLACGTGQTTDAILRSLDANGTVHAVDASSAMQAEARAVVDDERVRWHVSVAHALRDVLAEAEADAVVCNSAIWQTDMAATFAAVYAALRPEGRFAFNIGRQFIMLPFTDEELNPPASSLHELVNAIAVLDHGHVPRPGGRGRLLSVDGVCELLRASGFEVKETTEFRYDDSVERQRDWLRIPIFTERLYPDLTVEQRLAAVDAAYERVDKRPTTSRWTAFLAVKPG